MFRMPSRHLVNEFRGDSIDSLMPLAHLGCFFFFPDSRQVKSDLRSYTVIEFLDRWRMPETKKGLSALKQFFLLC